MNEAIICVDTKSVHEKLTTVGMYLDIMIDHTRNIKNIDLKDEKNENIAIINSPVGFNAICAFEIGD